MYTYSLPVRRCQQLEKADRVKEQTHVTSAGTFYVVRDYIEKADLIIEEKLTSLQYKPKEDFSKLLVTRDMFLMHNRALEARFQTINEKLVTVDEKITTLRTEMNEKFRLLDYKFRILIILLLLTGLFNNVQFFSYIKRIFL